MLLYGPHLGVNEDSAVLEDEDNAELVNGPFTHFFYKNDFIRTTRLNFCLKIKNKLRTIDLCNFMQGFIEKNVARKSREFFVQNCVLVHLTCCRLPAKSYLDYQHVCSDN